MTSRARKLWIAGTLALAALTATALIAIGWTLSEHGPVRIKRYARHLFGGSPPSLGDFPSYYQVRLRTFWTEPARDGAIVLAGDSLTEYHDWSRLCPGLTVLNRGISGDTTLGLKFRTGELLRHAPRRIIILIGINDLHFGRSADALFETYEDLIDDLRALSPHTELVLTSLLPINPNAAKADRLDWVSPAAIPKLNERLRALASSRNLRFLDVYSALARDGLLGLDYTLDGIHLTETGYSVWTKVLSPFGC